MKLTSLSLALTCYNEESALKDTVAKALEFLPTAADQWELLIVDDGSNDHSAEVAATLASTFSNVRVLTHERNLGMGAAIHTAILAAKMDWFCTIAADGQVDPRDLKAFVAPALESQAVFSTYSTRRDGLDRAFLSLGLRILMLLFARIWKIPTGNYFIRTAVLRNLRLQATSFFLNYEVYFGARISEMAIRWVEIPCAQRPSGKSKVRNLKTILQVAKELYRYRFGSVS